MRCWLAGVCLLRMAMHSYKGAALLSDFFFALFFPPSPLFFFFVEQRFQQLYYCDQVLYDLRSHTADANRKVYSAADGLVHMLKFLPTVSKSNMRTVGIYNALTRLKRVCTRECDGMYAPVAEAICTNFTCLVADNAYLHRLMDEVIGLEQHTPFACSLLDLKLSAQRYLVLDLQRSGHMTSTLLQFNVDVDKIQDNGETLLHVAVRFHRVDAVTRILSQTTNPNCFNKDGYTPFSIACSMLGQSDLYTDSGATLAVVKVFLSDKRVDKECFIPADAYCAKDSFPLLYIAVLGHKYNSIFSWLLREVKNPAQENAAGYSTLGFLSSSTRKADDTNFYKLVKDYRVDINTNGKGKNMLPVMYAMKNNCVEKARCLVNHHKFDPNKRSRAAPLMHPSDVFNDSREMWPLFTWICSHPISMQKPLVVEFARMLLWHPHGHNLTHSKLNALRWAVHNANKELIHCLIAFGGNPRDNFGVRESPYDYAVKRNIDKTLLYDMHLASSKHPIESAVRFNLVPDVVHQMQINDPSWCHAVAQALPHGNVVHDAIKSKWKPMTHKFWHVKHQLTVKSVLSVCAHYELRDNEDDLPHLPIEIWLEILGWINRNDYRDTYIIVPDDSSDDGSDDGSDDDTE